MKLLGDKKREEFAKAAGVVHELVEVGVKPGDAIIKVARDNGFSPDLTRRLCECYNLGQVYHRFRTFSDLDEKLASVPVVNREDAVKSLFPDGEAIEKKAVAAAEYSRAVPDIVSLRKRVPAPEIKKAAEKKPEKLGWLKMFNEIKKLGHHASVLSSRSLNLGIDATARINKTAAMIRKADASFQDIDLRTTAALGKEASPLMNVLAEKLGEKRADFVKFAGRSFAVNMHAEPFRSISECFDLACKIRDVLKKEAEVAQELEQKTAALFEVLPEEQKAPVSTWLRIHRLFRPGQLKKLATKKEGGSSLPWKVKEAGLRFSRPSADDVKELSALVDLAGKFEKTPEQLLAMKPRQIAQAFKGIAQRPGTEREDKEFQETLSIFSKYSPMLWKTPTQIRGAQPATLGTWMHGAIKRMVEEQEYKGMAAEMGLAETLAPFTKMTPAAVRKLSRPKREKMIRESMDIVRERLAAEEAGRYGGAFRSVSETLHVTPSQWMAATPQQKREWEEDALEISEARRTGEETLFGQRLEAGEEALIEARGRRGLLSPAERQKELREEVESAAVERASKVFKTVAETLNITPGQWQNASPEQKAKWETQALKRITAEQKSEVKRREQGLEVGETAALRAKGERFGVSPKRFMEEVRRSRERELKTEKLQLKKLRQEVPSIGRRAWQLLGGMRKTMKGFGEEAEETRKVMEALVDVRDVLTPEHESELLRIKAQALLNQFLSADPVLREMDPADVVEAFNEVRDMRPDLILNPALMKGMIRTLLEQSQMLEPALAVKLLEKPKIEEGAK